MKNNYITSMFKSEFNLVLKRSILFILISNSILFQMNAQCSVSALFTSNNFLGSTPKTVTFTSTSTGNPTSFNWKINGTTVGTLNSLTYTFNSSDNYNVCLIVGDGACTSEYCLGIPIGSGAGCDSVCEPINNFDFEVIFNPSAPGTQGSSDNFDTDVCGWHKTVSSPYYCFYQTNSYIALRMHRIIPNGSPERAAMTIPLRNLVHGKKYQICWKYSIQQQYNVSQFPPSFILEKPQAIYIEKNNASGISPIVIRSISNPDVNAPSSNGNILAPLDYDCFSPEEIDWVVDCFEFTYDSNLPYLSISGLNNATQQPYYNYHIPYLFVDYLKISCPPTCGEPPIFSYATSGCGASFTLENQPVYGNVVWNYGDGTSGTSNSHTYLYPGIFEVCATLNCEDGTNATYCKKVTITAEACSNSCITLSSVTAVKLCGEENPYLGNVTIDIPKGYNACNSSPVLTTTNSTIGVSLNSFIVTSASSSSDKISLSFNINPSATSSFPSTGINFAFSLCDKNGNSICFIVPVNGIQCTNCLTEELTAQCDEESSFPGNYVYSGNFTNGFNGIPLASVAGFTITGSAFQVTSSQQLPSGPLTIIGYTNIGTSITCTKYIINIEPCDPLPTECVAFWNPKVFFCEERDRNTGTVKFEIPNMSIPLAQNGVTYSLCNGVLGASIEGGGAVNINNGSISNGNLNFDLTILMPADVYSGELYEMRLYLCDPDGNVVCFLFKLMLFCDDESQGRIRFGLTKDDDIVVFPNPTSEYVTFQIQETESSISRITIIDQIGRTVHSDSYFSSLLNLNTTNFAPGIYMCNIEDNFGNTFVKKLIIQK